MPEDEQEEVEYVADPPAKAKVAEPEIPEDAIASVKVFFEDASFTPPAPIHIEFSGSAKRSLIYLKALMAFGHSQEYIGHQGFSSGKSATSPKAPEPRPHGFKCPICKGEMWDNRPKKASGDYSEKASDFTCKEDTDHKFVIKGKKLLNHWSMNPKESGQDDWTYEGE